MNLSRKIFAITALFGLSASVANAQSLRFAEGSVHLNGVRPGQLRVLFDNQGANVGEYRMVFSYPPQALMAPTVSVCETAAQCTVDIATSTVHVISSATATAPLNAENACLLELFAATGSTVGFIPLTVISSEFFDTSGNPIAGTSTNGSMAVLPGESSPLWQFGPAADSDCHSDAQPEVSLAPPPAATSISIQSIGASSNAGTVAISCGVSQGFVVLSGGEQEIPGNGVPQPIELACASTAETTGTLICAEASSGGERLFLWDLSCAGLVFANGFEAAQ